MKHFNKHVDFETTKFTLSLLHQTHDLIDIQHELKNHWSLKIADNMQWSDLVREEEFRNFISSIKQMIVNSLFKETKLQMWQTIKQKELNRKKFSRKRLRFETDNLTWRSLNAKLADSKQTIWNSLKRMRSKLLSQSCKKRKMMKKSELMLSLWEFDEWSETRCIQKT